MRKYRSDVTDVYRDKVTRDGKYTARDCLYNNKIKVGDPWQTIDYYGPYGTKAVSGGTWWRNPGETIKIESQKLECVGYEGQLGWATFRIKLIEPEDDE